MNNKHNYALSKGMLKKYPFMALLNPLGGVVRSLSDIKVKELGAPRLNAMSASLGNQTMINSDISFNTGKGLDEAIIGGAGAGDSIDDAVVRSVAEAAERYATCVVDKQKVIIASATELGDEAIDISRVPVCSEKEYSDPQCPVDRPSLDTDMRWTKGYSLTDAREKYVPIAMTHLFTRPWQGENINAQITTGVAHTDTFTAAVSAICEVVERDAIALVWLMGLPLKRIVFDENMPENFRDRFKKMKSSQVETIYFDATTDIGVPTVYSLQLKGNDPISGQFVNCVTSFDAWECCAKLVRESACGRSVLGERGETPDDIADFIKLEEGAAYMGKFAQRHAFEFLINNEETVPISALNPNVGPSKKQELSFLVDRFKQLNMDVVLVDLTTDELRDVGLEVIRAVIPDLMPMTSVHRARFLGHPRLYNYYEKLTGKKLDESNITAYPQPFA